MKVEIYDPAMCCPTGLCGPAIDPALVKISEVQRFSLAQQTKAFMDNKKVADLLHNNGKKALPVIIVNGEVLKTGAYPSYEELCNALGIEPLKAKPISLQMK